MHTRSTTSPFFAQLQKKIDALGGAFNAHLHLDRYGTLDNHYMASTQHQILENSHVSLHKKHSLIGSLHAGPAFERDNLMRRVNECLDVMVATNTRRADTMVDVTADNIQLDALHWMQEIKQQRAGEIDLRLAAYSPFGFTDKEPQRWEIFQEGAKTADFLGALPEADDIDDYPDHIGFMPHCQRILELAQDLNQSVHVHVDQRNEASETGTERLIEAVKRYGAPRLESGEPSIWAVHAISPSTYDEKRFSALLQNLVDLNIGIICCPSAAIGMRQLRPIMSPTTNSIPRVLEFVAAGVHVRLGSDNIADICSPSTTADLNDEVFVLSAALRYYEINALAQLAAGLPFNTTQRQIIQDHLDNNEREIAKAVSAAQNAQN